MILYDFYKKGYQMDDSFTIQTNLLPFFFFSKSAPQKNSPYIYIYCFEN